MPQDMMEYRDFVCPEILAVILCRLESLGDRRTPTCSALGERGLGAPDMMSGVVSCQYDAEESPGQ